MKNYSKLYFESISQGLNNSIYSINQKKINPELFFEKLLKLTFGLKNSKSRIFFIGNGASASFANHMALDWSKNGGILSHSLSDSSLLTALSNDYNYESAFSEFLKINNVSSSDLVVTISSSGNSGNITNVLDFCIENKIQTLGFSGLKNDNKSIIKANYSIYVPSKTYGMVECIHQIFLHLWLDYFMNVKEWSRDSYQNMNSDNFII